MRKAVHFDKNIFKEASEKGGGLRLGILQKTDSPILVREAENFKEELNSQISWIVQYLAMSGNEDSADPCAKMRKTLIQVCRATKECEDDEIKDALIQFWAMVPKDGGLFREDKWWKVSRSLGATKETAGSLFEDFGRKVDRGGNVELQTNLIKLKDGLKNYDQNTFEEGCAIYESREEFLKLDLDRLREEYRNIVTQLEVVNDDQEKLIGLQKLEENLKSNLVAREKDLAKTKIEGHIFCITPQEEDLSRQFASIKAGYQGRRLEIESEIAEMAVVTPKNQKQFDARLRMLNWEEELSLANLMNSQLPCNYGLIEIIKSDSELMAQYKNIFQNEVEKHHLVQKIPFLKEEIAFLKFIKNNSDQGVRLNSWIEEFINNSSEDTSDIGESDSEWQQLWRKSKKAVSDARTNLCGCVYGCGENAVKVELMEHLQGGVNYREDNAKVVISQSKNLEIQKASLNYEKAIAELEYLAWEKDFKDCGGADWDLEASERRKEISILGLKSNVIEIKIKEVSGGEGADKIQQALQLLTKEENDLEDLQMENFITRSDHRRIGALKSIYFGDDIDEEEACSEWRRENIENLEKNLKKCIEGSVVDSASLEALERMKYQMKLGEVAVGILKKEQEVELAKLNLRIDEEILSFAKEISYPAVGRKFSGYLIEKLEEKALLEEKVSTSAADLRGLVRLKKDYELDCRIEEIDKNLKSYNLGWSQQIGLEQRHVDEFFGAKITLCIRIKECDDIEAKNLTVDYLDEEGCGYYINLSNEISKFQNPNIRKIFTDYELVSANYDLEVMAARIGNQNPEDESVKSLTSTLKENIATKQILEIRSKIIDAEIDDLQRGATIGNESYQKRLQEDLRVAQTDLTKARIETCVFGARSEIYNRHLVSLITSLPRSEARFDEILQQEIDKVLPKGSRFVSAGNPDIIDQGGVISEELFSPPKNNTGIEELPNNSPEGSKVINLALGNEASLGKF